MPEPALWESGKDAGVRVAQDPEKVLLRSLQAGGVGFTMRGGVALSPWSPEVLGDSQAVRQYIGPGPGRDR